MWRRGSEIQDTGMLLRKYFIDERAVEHVFKLDTFYQTKEWQGLRTMLMHERVNENGELICAHCGKPITRQYDCIGHHTIELTEDNVNDVSISLNPKLIELIHFKCHNKIHDRFQGFRQYVYLVYGAPCSGKTTWVNEVANEDDLIVDMDSIWQSICKADRFHKPNRLKANAFGVRDCLIDQIRTRKGMWRNAYVIGGYPLRSDRDRLCDLLKAEPVFIEATPQECMDRAETDDWKDYICEWFEAYSE